MGSGEYSEIESAVMAPGSTGFEKVETNRELEKTVAPSAGTMAVTRRDVVSATTAAVVTAGAPFYGDSPGSPVLLNRH